MKKSWDESLFNSNIYDNSPIDTNTQFYLDLLFWIHSRELAPHSLQYLGMYEFPPVAGIRTRKQYNLAANIYIYKKKRNQTIH